MNTHDVLAVLLSGVTCKPGWSFHLAVSAETGALELIVSIPVADSRGGAIQRINNHFPVPIATYNFKSWRRWIFERCRQVEDHELGEWFRVDGDRPFAPLHGPGCDPYMIREVSTDEETRTDQRGHVAPPSIQPDSAKEG
jgi:hypothetical protein